MGCRENIKAASFQKLQENHPLRVPGKGAHSTFLTHRQPQNVVGGGQGKAEPRGVVAQRLEDGPDDTSACFIGTSQSPWLLRTSPREESSGPASTPPLPPQLTVLSSSRSRYFSLGSRRVTCGRRDLRTK